MELLVVIAIIGILIALLLPAVQAAREAARRSQCSDNLKNLALACQSYLDAKKNLPPGKVAVETGTETGNCTNFNEYSNWALEILPFIEETPLYRQYHFDRANDDASNDLVRKTALKIQTCPTDPNPPSVQTPAVSAPDAMTSSYKGVAGRGWFAATNPAEAYWGSPKAGVTGDNMSVIDRGPLPAIVTPPSNGTTTPACTMYKLSRYPVKMRLITDGTSKTLIIGEYTTITQPAGTPPKSRSAFWANSTYGLNLGDISLPVACRTNPLGCPYGTVNANPGGTSVTLDPDYNRCVAGTYPSFPQPCERTFTGYHGGGNTINFAFVDGSVHPLANTVDMRILAAMATIAGGESIQVP